MTQILPSVVYISDELEMVDLVALSLSDQFEVTPLEGVLSLEDALTSLRQLKPAFVIVDPRLESLDHQQLHTAIQADAELREIQILIVRDQEPDAET